MPRFVRDSLICLSIIILIPASSLAMSRIKDADAVISMRNGNPCFSYPQDEEIQKRRYSFGYLDVSSNVLSKPNGWEIGIASPDRKFLIEPNSPETCVEYGIPNSGMEVRQTAEPLRPNTPYRVLIIVGTVSNGPYYERKYLSNFCVIYNDNGDPILVAASGGGKGQWRCLKPGEYPERGFWDILFGK